MFLRKYEKKRLFCGHNTFTEDVFVTRLSSNAGISVLRIVWVRTNCCPMSDTLLYNCTRVCIRAVESESEGIVGGVGVGRNFRCNRSWKEF
jgi:hypothetical protein